jgi:hypothetical protein
MTTYKYRIRAINGSTYSDYSTILTVSTNKPVPNTPSNLAGSNIKSSSVTLTWKDNSGIETGYELQRLSELDVLLSTINLDANSVSFDDSGLEPNTQYQYRVRGIDEIGYSDFSNSIAIITLPNSENSITGEVDRKIDKVSDKIIMNVFPNPNDGHFNIQLSNSSAQKLEIMDNTGRIVYEISNIHDSPVNVDMGEAAPGIYILRMISDGQNLVKKLVIK